MPTWTQIIILILAFGGPALGGLLKWLDKQSKARARQKALEAARLEALRTGKTMPTQVSVQAPVQNPSERAAELIRRRQAQIEELRRRQQEARQAQARTTARPQPAANRAQPGTGRPMPAAGRPPQASGRPQPPRGGPQPAPAGSGQRGPGRGAGGRSPAPSASRQKPAPKKPAVPTTPPAGEEDTTPKMPAHEPHADPRQAQPVAGTPRAPVALLGQQMTPADWRRFIVARELLEPPLSLRSPSQAPFSRI